MAAARPNLDEMRHGDEAAPFLFVVDRIREAMAAGLLRQGDPGRVALSVWAHIHGLCALSLAGRIPPGQLGPACRASLEHLYRGVGSRTEDES